MTKQQINLLPPQPKKVFDPLSASACIVWLILVIFVSGAGAGISHWYGGRLDESNSRLTTQYQKLDAQASAIEKKLLARRPDPALKRQEAQLKSDIAAMERLSKVLAGVQPETRTRFSAYMHGLAVADFSGIWLTAFSLSQEEQKVVLEGNTLKSENLPLLLQALGQSSAFRGSSLQEVSVQQTEANALLMFRAAGSLAGEGQP